MLKLRMLEIGCIVDVVVDIVVVVVVVVDVAGRFGIREIHLSSRRRPTVHTLTQFKSIDL